MKIGSIKEIDWGVNWARCLVIALLLAMFLWLYAPEILVYLL